MVYGSATKSSAAGGNAHAKSHVLRLRRSHSIPSGYIHDTWLPWPAVLISELFCVLPTSTFQQPRLLTLGSHVPGNNHAYLGRQAYCLRVHGEGNYATPYRVFHFVTEGTTKLLNEAVSYSL